MERASDRSEVNVAKVMKKNQKDNIKKSYIVETTRVKKVIQNFHLGKPGKGKKIKPNNDS